MRPTLVVGSRVWAQPNVFLAWTADDCCVHGKYTPMSTETHQNQKTTVPFENVYKNPNSSNNNEEMQTIIRQSITLNQLFLTQKNRKQDTGSSKPTLDG